MNGSSVSFDSPNWFKIGHIPEKRPGQAGGFLSVNTPNSYRPPTAKPDYRPFTPPSGAANALEERGAHGRGVSSLSITEIGMHDHLGQRLLNQKASARQQYLEASRHSTDNDYRTAQPVSGDPNVMYSHTMAKINKFAAMRRSGNNNFDPNLMTRHGMVPYSSSVSRDLGVARDNIRGNTFVAPVQTARSDVSIGRRTTQNFSSSYAPRKKDHIAHGFNPRLAGDKQDVRATYSHYCDAPIARMHTAGSDRPWTPNTSVLTCPGDRGNIR
jgi:hypothetical protein